MSIESRLQKLEQKTTPPQKIVIILPEHTGDRADGEKTFVSEGEARARWPEDELFVIKIVYSDNVPGFGSRADQS